jgi:hypothetical protein
VIAKDLLRAAVLVLIGLGIAIFALVQGLSRSDGRGPVYLVLGAALVLSVVAVAAGIVRLRRQECALSEEERQAARAARLERAERSRPEWLDSRGWFVLMVAVAAYWGYWLVGALADGAHGRAVVNGLLLLVSVSAAVRAFRRRRTKDD